MTFLDTLDAAGRQNQSMLCVGLDQEPTRFPGKLKGDANKIYDFCAAIFDATANLVVSFKPQIAYLIAHRTAGLPFGRMTEPAEISDLTVFSCSPLAGYLSGTLLNVDGGQSFASPV